MTDQVKSRPARRSRWRLLFRLLILSALIVVLLLVWLVSTQGGLRQIAVLATKFSNGQLVVDAPQGHLAGTFSLPRVVIATPQLQLEIRELELSWRPLSLLRRVLEIDSLSVAQVDVASLGDDNATAKQDPVPPQAVNLPLSMLVRSLNLQRFNLRSWPQAGAPLDAGDVSFEVKNLTASLESDGQQQRLERLNLLLPFGEANLAGGINLATAPFALAFQGQLSGEHEGQPFTADLVATGDLLSLLVQVQATHGDVRARIDLLAAPFETMPLRQLKLQVASLDPSQFLATAPRAELMLEADFSSVDAKTLALRGPVVIRNSAPLPLDQQGLPLRSLQAMVFASPSAVEVNELLAQLVGDGTLTGLMLWQGASHDDATEGGLGHVTGELNLENINLQFLDKRLPTALLQGSIRGEGNGEQQTAEIDLKLGDARALLSLGFAAADSPGGMNFDASGRLERFDPQALMSEAPPADLNVDFAAHGLIAEQPDIALNWVFAPSKLDHWPLLGEGQGRLQGERLTLSKLFLEVAGNHVLAEGNWGAANDVLQLKLAAPDLARLGQGLGGRAYLDASISGTAQAPFGQVEGRFEALQLPGEIQLDALEMKAKLEPGMDGAVSLALKLGGLGKAKEPPWVATGEVQLDGRLDQHLLQLQASTPQDDSLHLQLKGGYTQAGLSWQGLLQSFETSGRVPLKLLEATALALSAQGVSLGESRIDAGQHGQISLNKTLWSPQQIQAQGSLTGLTLALTEAPSGDEDSEAEPAETLQFGMEWDLQLAQQAQGQIRLFREEGDLVLADGERSLRLGLEQLEVKLTAQGETLHGHIEAGGTSLGKLGGNLLLPLRRDSEGQWQLPGDGALAGELQLVLPSLAQVAKAVQDELELDGNLSARVSIGGTLASPEVTGKLEGKALSFGLLTEGLRLSGGELLADFDRDRLKLTRLEFISPNLVELRDERLPLAELTKTPGRLTASGEMSLESGVGAFQFEFDRMPLLQRLDRWMVFSGKGEASTGENNMKLAANFMVDAGYLEFPESPPPRLSEDVTVLSDEHNEAGEGKGGMAMDVNVVVSLGKHLYLSALGLDTRLGGDIRVRMQEGGLEGVGSIQTIDGVFKGYGQNLSLQQGFINFQGALDNPGLNIVALRKGLEVEAGVEVTGSARRPQIKLISSPDVPEQEKLSWIVLGRGMNEGSEADLGALLPAAQSLLGGGGAGLTDQLRQGLGLDELNLGQGELNSVSRSASSQVVGSGSTISAGAETSGQVLTLGKKLTDDLSLTFEQSLGGTETLLKLSYQLSRRLSLVARGGTKTSTDLYYTVSFR